MAKWTLSSGSDIVTADFTYHEAHVLQFGCEVLSSEGMLTLAKKIVHLNEEGSKLCRKHKDDDIACQVANDEMELLIVLAPKEDED